MPFMAPTEVAAAAFLVNPWFGLGSQFRDNVPKHSLLFHCCIESICDTVTIKTWSIHGCWVAKCPYSWCELGEDRLTQFLEVSDAEVMLYTKILPLVQDSKRCASVVQVAAIDANS